MRSKSKVSTQREPQRTPQIEPQKLPPRSPKVIPKIQNPELLFKYHDLKLEGVEVSGQLLVDQARAALGELIGTLGYWVDQPFEVSGILYRTESGEVISDLTVKGTADFICVSCAARASLVMDITEGLIIVPQGHPIAQETDMDGEGELEISPDIYTFEGHEIDLGEVLHEVLILNAPSHPRCEDAGATCGPSIAERESDVLPIVSEIDARWAPLLAMQEALESERTESERDDSSSNEEES